MARGLMLGLLLGDAVDEWEAGGQFHGTCAAQLACFTLEGAIRADVRGSHKGICSPPSVIWHALCRWAHIQGLGDGFARAWSAGSDTGTWPDGWLQGVRPLSVRRGSAPATVGALRSSPRAGEGARNSSAGHHALTRTLSLAIVFPDLSIAKEVAALTHGHPDAQEAAAAGVNLVRGYLHGETRPTPVEQAPRGTSTTSAPGTAAHALLHAVEAVLVSSTFEAAVLRARLHGHGAATAAGAIFGAAHGAEALPDTVERLEIGRVGDQLARDAVEQVKFKPAGHEYLEASDQTWWGRYPGW